MFEFRLPDLGEGIHEGELLKWHVEEKDRIKEDDPLCDLETDKAAVTIPCPCTGIVLKLGAKQGDTVTVGSVLVTIDDKGSRAVAPPAVRRLAREMGIDINRVMGSGPGGRVTRDDLAAFDTSGEIPDASGPDAGNIEPEPPAVPENPPPAAGPAIPFLEVGALPDYSAQGPVEIVPMRSLRRKTAVKTTSASLIVPHVAHMDEIDVTDLSAMRGAYNEKQSPEGRLTLLAFTVKAAASLLKTFGEFNASVNPHSMEMVLKKYIHIGFAADTPKGLMVPVLRDADRWSVAALGHRIRGLAQKARENRITPGEITGGTFTITNVGAVGGTHVLPIINYPESAILGMGRVEKKPVVRGDAVVIRKLLPVTLCFDHRVADGVRAARFVKGLKDMLEDPVTFMTQI